MPTYHLGKVVKKAILRSLVAVGIELSLLTISSAVSAQQSVPSLDFSADRAVVEARGRQVELNGNVQVACGRYRLNAEHLEIGVQWDGVHVVGPGEVTLCPCSEAPVNFAFDSATIRPPSDLIVRSPSLQIGGMRVLWLPVLWLRSPDRIGLLAPRLAWRGNDGFLAGFGVHLPLNKTGKSALDLYISGYAKGGVEFEPNLYTQFSRTRLRWDHLKEDLLEARSDGSTDPESDGAFAGWTVDVIRGSRGLGAVVDVYQAARRYDEVRAYVSIRPGNGSMLATGMEGFGYRGNSSIAWGPVGTAFLGGNVWDLGGYSVQASLRSVGAAVPTQISRAVMRGEVNPSLGPLVVRVNALAALSSVLQDSASQEEARVSASTQASVPLQRYFGSGEEPLVHLVEPFMRALVTGSRGTSFESFVPTDSFSVRGPSLGLFGAGMRTSIGRSGSDRGLVLEALLGEIYPSMDREVRKQAASGNVSFSSGVFGIGAMGAYVRQGGVGGTAVLGRARVGEQDSTHIALRLALQGGLDPAIVRTVNQAEAVQPWTSFFDRNGTSLGGELSLPLPKKLMLSSGADVDVESERFLSTRVGLGYRHPCGCVAASAWASQRVGREGVDAWLSVDLAPR